MSDTEMTMAVAIAFLWVAGGSYINSQMKEENVISSFGEQIFLMATWPLIMGVCMAYMAARSSVKSIKGIFQ